MQRRQLFILLMYDYARLFLFFFAYPYIDKRLRTDNKCKDNACLREYNYDGRDNSFYWECLLSLLKAFVKKNNNEWTVSCCNFFAVVQTIRIWLCKVINKQYFTVIWYGIALITCMLCVYVCALIVFIFVFVLFYQLIDAVDDNIGSAYIFDINTRIRWCN